MSKRSKKPTEQPTSIRMPADLKQRLNVIAKKRRTYRAQLIISILEQWVATQEMPAEPTPQAENAA